LKFREPAPGQEPPASDQDWFAGKPIEPHASPRETFADRSLGLSGERARQTMSLESLSDSSVLQFYESIRQQVAADATIGGEHRLIGSSVRERADYLRGEIDRRHLSCVPIDWPRIAP
jgi:hypothetical protein